MKNYGQLILVNCHFNQKLGTRSYLFIFKIKSCLHFSPIPKKSSVTWTLIYTMSNKEKWITAKYDESKICHEIPKQVSKY